jgi:hypothetical protein
MQQSQILPQGSGEWDGKLQQLNERFGSKGDLHTYMSTCMQLFLPRKEQCPLLFLQGIVNNDKKALTRSQVGMWTVVSYNFCSGRLTSSFPCSPFGPNSP